MFNIRHKDTEGRKYHLVTKKENAFIVMSAAIAMWAALSFSQLYISVIMFLYFAILYVWPFREIKKRIVAIPEFTSLFVPGNPGYRFPNQISRMVMGELLPSVVLGFFLGMVVFYLPFII